MKQTVKGKFKFRDFTIKLCRELGWKVRSRAESVNKWTDFIKNNPNKWKKIHTKFVNAELKKAEEFYKRLAKTKEGREKIRKIFDIKNIKKHPFLN